MDQTGTKSKAKAKVSRPAKAKNGVQNQRSSKQAITKRKASSTKTKKPASEVTKPGITHSTGEEEDTRVYKVVINHEEQYSIWFADRDPPLGWQAVGKEGLKTECLSYIDEVWTDMRPLSLRNKMEADAKKGAEERARAN